MVIWSIELGIDVIFNVIFMYVIDGVFFNVIDVIMLKGMIFGLVVIILDMMFLFGIYEFMVIVINYVILC